MKEESIYICYIESLYNDNNNNNNNIDVKQDDWHILNIIYIYIYELWLYI